MSSCATTRTKKHESEREDHIVVKQDSTHSTDSSILLDTPMLSNRGPRKMMRQTRSTSSAPTLHHGATKGSQRRATISHDHVTVNRLHQSPKPRTVRQLLSIDKVGGSSCNGVGEAIAAAPNYYDTIQRIHEARSQRQALSKECTDATCRLEKRDECPIAESSTSSATSDSTSQAQNIVEMPFLPPTQQQQQPTVDPSTWLTNATDVHNPMHPSHNLQLIDNTPAAMAIASALAPLSFDPFARWHAHCAQTGQSCGDGMLHRSGPPSNRSSASATPTPSDRSTIPTSESCSTNASTDPYTFNLNADDLAQLSLDGVVTWPPPASLLWPATLWSDQPNAMTTIMPVALPCPSDSLVDTLAVVDATIDGLTSNSNFAQPDGS